MIPVAQRLLNRGNNVFIGSGKEHQALFSSEIQGLKYIDFHGFSPGYSRYLPQYLYMFLSMPLLFYNVILEHFRLKRIILKNNIDIVISDNRFGLWNRNIKTVYVTHQLIIPFPGIFRSLEWTGVILHRFFIKKYDFCFIPDLPGDINVSGRLSHCARQMKNVRFIGILSRFSDNHTPAPGTKGFLHNTLILSGPEPQRRMLRMKISEALKGSNYPLVILEGKPGIKFESSESDNIISYNHLLESRMKEIITGSEAIIARSGYTSVMELISLNCSALLIPTPGQTEQEYLADHLSKKGWFSSVSQKDITSGMILPEKNASWPTDLVEKSNILFERALDELLNEQNK